MCCIIVVMFKTKLFGVQHTTAFNFPFANQQSEHYYIFIFAVKYSKIYL